MATMMGFPVVLLTTKGAKTGEERTVSLGGFADGSEAWLIVASNNGSPRHPAWFKNLVRFGTRTTFRSKWAAAR
jgi:deazaflavin-dependent oxidoreductase (nitroreductase family)